MYGVTRVFSQQYQFFYSISPYSGRLMIADVNVMHTRIRRETAMFSAMGGGSLQLLEETPIKLTPRKYPSQKKEINVCRPLELTLPDSETFVPEFGLHLPPELTLNFELGSPTPGARDQIDYNLNLSETLQTPLHGLNHEFSLPGYNISAGLNSTDSAFGDYSGGFDDDDILRNADDNAETLDFNLEPTPTRPPKRVGTEDGGTLKRARYTSADGTDDEVQRIAREDHNLAQPSNFDDFGNDTGFGDPGFDEYRTPPPAETAPEQVGEGTAPARKKQRIVIVEDEAAMIGDRDFRSWPAKYIEMQEVSHLRRKNLEMNRIAKKNAVNCVWGWGGKEIGSLPPLLDRLFSREALLQRWTGESDAVVALGKRKRDDEEGEVEFGLGMGDNGGFDTMDYGVLH
jgi:hypothetical protein